ncbi:hypothetical protein Pfo_029030 [Paulownia fortunei]|nr:hypothetical protein Pfo_029030 [Paulownia fortunei]
MSTWQIFSDARNSFRWEMSDQQLEKEEQCDAWIMGTGNVENPPMFRTGLGKSVDVKQSSLAKARSVLGDIDDAVTDTVHQEMLVNMSNSMFQTGSGKTVNISSAGLLRAKTLLGLDENYNRESLHGFEQKQKQSTSTDLLAWENPSHLETQDPSNLSFSSSTKVLTSSSVKSGSCRSESMKFPDFMNSAPKPPPVKFHTAGGRSISVSSDALKRARSLLGNPECDSFLNEASTADPLFSVIDDGKPSCSSNQKNGYIPQGILHPPRSSSYQKQSFGKSEKLRPGNNLITQFDAEAEINTSNRPYNVLTCDRKPLKNNSYSEKVDLENAVQPKIDPSKRRLQRISSVSPFKKPRSSFVTPLNKKNSSDINVLSRLAPKELCCKQRVSTRYPLQVPRVYLKEYVLQPPSLQKKLENLPEYVKRMNPIAAESHTFQNEIPSDCVGPEGFYWMLSQSGASIQYLTKEWVSNHYKWIVWKLASYERCYPAKFAGKLLTVSNVLEELRYRYERELNHGHRSSIKKILDGDAPPSSMMVLCISSVGENHDPKFGNQSVSLEEDGNDRASKIELTDGWYSVKALLDELLSHKLASGKLFLGQKLRIWGAKLCGWLGPVSPFEASQTTSLLLHINGTYRCHWAERLGFCKRAGVPLAFRCIKGTGGAVPSTLVGVTRIYPVLYRERLSNGSFIVRSERVEAKALQLYNQRRDVVAEGIISAFQRETEFDVGYDHESFNGGDELKTTNSFASYKAKLEAMRQSEMQKSIENAVEAAGLSEREVTPFLRVKVVGLTNKCHPRECCPQKGLITIWNPTQKQTLELCEGQAYAVGGLVPSSSDSGTLYLQARGSTSNWLPLPFFTPRSSTTISNLGEVPLSRQGHQQKQWMFVTDGSTDEFCSKESPDALLAINFCLPCIEFDSSEPVNSNIAGSVVGFVNLTKRPKDQVNGLWVAEATKNSDYFLSYDHAGRNHLKDVAASVLKWANTSSLITEKLKESVLSLIRNSKDGC